MYMLELIVVVALFMVMVLACKKKSAAPAAASATAAAAGAQPPPREYDYSDILYAEGLSADTASSHRKYIEDTYSNALLLGSSKDVIRDDTNDINPVLGFRRADYDTVIGVGARQVPSEYRDQLPDRAPPQFV